MIRISNYQPKLRIKEYVVVQSRIFLFNHNLIYELIVLFQNNIFHEKFIEMTKVIFSCLSSTEYCLEKYFTQN